MKSGSSRGSKSSTTGISLQQLTAKLKAAASPEAESRGQAPGEVLAAAGCPSPIVVVSSDRVRITRLIEWLRERLACTSPHSFFRFQPFDLTSPPQLSQAVMELRGGSLFATRKLVFFPDASEFKGAVAKTLAEPLENPSPDVVVVTSCESIPARHPFLETAKKRGTVVTLDEMDPQTARRWVEREVERNGGTRGIAPSAVEKLLEACGTRAALLAPAIERLSLLTRCDEAIADGTVKQSIESLQEGSSFELFEKIARGQVRSALRSLDTLLAAGTHPLQVSQFLSRAVRCLIAAGGPQPSRELGHPWFINNLSKVRNRFSGEHLSASIAVLARLDLDLKGGALAAESSLKNAVLRIASRQFGRA